MQFTQVSNWNIPEGEVIRVTDSLNRVIWEKETPKATDYFWIKDVSGSNNTVTIKKTQDSSEHWITPTITVYYSTDQINWTSMGSTSTTGITVTIPANAKVYFRATADTWSSTHTNYHNFFDISGNCTVGGNVMSLIYGNNFANQTAFPNDSKCNLAEILASNPITNASLLVLPATTLTESCYYGMFMNCYNLAAAPELPATTLARQCYQLMFSHCTSLTTAPALPATTLAQSCYSSMFGNCTNLRTAPELPATTLAVSCYVLMFSGCTSLNSVTTYAQDISATNCLNNWLLSVAATGTFNNMGSATYQIDSASGIPTGWTEHTLSNEYFYVEDASGADNTLTIVHSSDAPNFTVYTSTNQSDWTSIGNTSTGNLTTTIPANSKLYLRATTSAWGSAAQLDSRIRVANNYNVGGNIMTLLKANPSYTSLSSSDNCTFLGLFVNETKLLNANLLYLPTDTKRYCYYAMFGGCTNLRTAPALPATTMTEDCYESMFSGCTSLTQAPTLPATTLARECYRSMFERCTSLTTAPALPATTLAEWCYSNMFQGCTSLTQAPALPATTLAERCYNNMFYNCTSLTQAPALPATTLADSCYVNMFYNCTSLTQAPALPATTLAERCYAQMFNDCTSLTQAPVLPATTLTNACYYFMFYGCGNLNSVTTYAQDISVTDCLTRWLDGVSSTGDFYNLGGATYPSGEDGIPTGWTEHTNPNI